MTGVQTCALPISLSEDKGDKFTVVLYCMAEDEDDAEKQALIAYPNGEIKHTILID